MKRMTSDRLILGNLGRELLMLLKMSGRELLTAPKSQSGKRSQSLGITPTTLWRVLKHDLCVFPYRIQTGQKLTNVDMGKRLAMAEKLVAKVESCDSFLGHLFTSVEAHFSERCTVWAAIGEKGII